MSKKIIIFIAGILLVLNILCWNQIFVLSGQNNLKVKFLNVGQGDSALIITSENHQILIDGGPDASLLAKLAENIPFWDKTLDLVILTHPESDHMQGLLYALQIYKADYILWTGVKKTAPEYTAWMNVLEKQKKMGARIIIASAGQEIKAGNVLIDTVYPLESVEGKDMKDSSNDAGVVSRVTFGRDSFLFTGDLSSKGEKVLIDSGENILANVLKVAHHGSKYSTSDLFLENVKPEFAVIEVGKNSYGHPTPETLQKLEKFGIKVFRTDKDGDVEFVSNGINININ
jgi:competence protein ComEC